jgi:hypothetical protein
VSVADRSFDVESHFTITVTDDMITKSLFLEIPENLFCTIGELCTFDADVVSSGYGNITYSADTDLFEIDSDTGYVSFVSYNSGNYSVIITAESDEGITAHATLEVMIA